jgi:glucosamine-6-phosphate deaminase
MNIRVFDSQENLAIAAAHDAAGIIRDAVTYRGHAFVIAATGASQFGFLRVLTEDPSIDWSKVVFFHLDEYVGLKESHPASFRRYLKERIVDRVEPGGFHFISGDSHDANAECRRLSDLISQQTIDVAFVGIGENGHLAFNDPPANFDTTDPYIVVELNETCRRQQVNEGWFTTVGDVPQYAISMSIQQILKARHILCIVPELRKAEAVRDCFELEVSPWRPASILRQHQSTTLYLDKESTSLLQDQRKVMQPSG